jgi:hypothetical protein
MPTKPAVTGKTVTPAAMPTVVSGKTGMSHKTIVPAVMVEPVMVEPVMVEPVMVEADMVEAVTVEAVTVEAVTVEEDVPVMVEAATPVREAQAAIIRSIVAVMLVGATGQGKYHAGQERYNTPHHCARIHRSCRSFTDRLLIRS